MYPEETLTKSKKGKIEARHYIDSGKFVRYDYLDPETGKKSENKYKIVLATENGYEEYFVIPMKQKNKFLMLRGEKKGRRKILKNGEIVDIFELLGINE